jgi:hypothetical protein
LTRSAWSLRLCCALLDVACGQSTPPSRSVLDSPVEVSTAAPISSFDLAPVEAKSDREVAEPSRSAPKQHSSEKTKTLKKACETGDSAACTAYAAEPGLSDEDTFKAVSLACMSGDTEACWRLQNDNTLVIPK